MSTTIKHVRMAPKGAKPTNPKYTLTLTKPQLKALYFMLVEKRAISLMDGVGMGRANLNLLREVQRLIDDLE